MNIIDITNISGIKFMNMIDFYHDFLFGGFKVAWK
jgi:hypothetical protein